MLNSPHDYYHRHLPHWQPAGAEYFATFRLKGSLPQTAIEQLKIEQKLLKKEATDIANSADTEKTRREKIFKRYEDLLDGATFGPTWLKNAEIAEIVADSIFFFDQSEYDLYAFTIMSNNVHMVFKLLQSYGDSKKYPVTSIIGRLKSYTANECNKKLNRSGSFWQDESWDRVIRNNDELERIIRYVLYNPVKAGLVEEWDEWKFTHCKEIFLEM